MHTYGLCDCILLQCLHSLSPLLLTVNIMWALSDDDMWKTLLLLRIQYFKGVEKSLSSSLAQWRSQVIGIGRAPTVHWPISFASRMNMVLWLGMCPARPGLRYATGLAPSWAQDNDRKNPCQDIQGCIYAEESRLPLQCIHRFIDEPNCFTIILK